MTTKEIKELLFQAGIEVSRKVAIELLHAFKDYEMTTTVKKEYIIKNNQEFIDFCNENRNKLKQTEKM